MKLFSRVILIFPRDIEDVKIGDKIKMRRQDTFYSAGEEGTVIDINLRTKKMLIEFKNSSEVRIRLLGEKYAYKQFAYAIDVVIVTNRLDGRSTYCNLVKEVKKEKRGTTKI